MITANEAIGELMTREKYRFVDKALLAEIARDTMDYVIANVDVDAYKRDSAYPF